MSASQPCIFPLVRNYYEKKQPTIQNTMNIKSALAILCLSVSSLVPAQDYSSLYDKYTPDKNGSSSENSLLTKLQNDINALKIREASLRDSLDEVQEKNDELKISQLNEELALNRQCRQEAERMLLGEARKRESVLKPFMNKKIQYSVQKVADPRNRTKIYQQRFVTLPGLNTRTTSREAARGSGSGKIKDKGSSVNLYKTTTHTGRLTADNYKDQREINSLGERYYNLARKIYAQNQQGGGMNSECLLDELTATAEEIEFISRQEDIDIFKRYHEEVLDAVKWLTAARTISR